MRQELAIQPVDWIDFAIGRANDSADFLVRNVHSPVVCTLTIAQAIGFESVDRHNTAVDLANDTPRHVVSWSRCMINKGSPSFACVSRRGLSSNQLTGTISPLVGQLTALTTLYGAFTNHVSSLCAVTVQRQLHNNQLTGTVPSSIGQLRNLTTLYVVVAALPAMLKALHAQVFANQPIDWFNTPDDLATDGTHGVVRRLSHECGFSAAHVCFSSSRAGA